MQKSLGGFRAALLIGWIALGAAGSLYARRMDIPDWAARPVLAAFLLEYLFYLAAGFESAREWLAGRVRGLWLPLCLAGSALLPYLVYSLGTHQFQWLLLLRLAALALTVSLWYALLPHIPIFDALFLVLLAAVMLRKFFDPIFIAPVPALRSISVLGHLMLIHLGALAVLLERRVDCGFGFIPNRREWSIGIRNFLFFFPIVLPIAFFLHLIHPGVYQFVWWKIPGAFFGSLWVVSLSEEFFFRGLLQNWLAQWTRNAAAALILASVLFGLAHLPFRGFPNWRMVLLTAILGFFCGRAFQQAGSIRAGMVTHALAVAAGALFSG